MGSFRYAFRDGLRLVFRHWGLSFLTLFTSVAVFFLIGASALFAMNARHIVGTLEGELAISAYLKPGADLKDIAAKVRRISQVKEVRIVTPEDALERLRARLGAQTEAVTLLGDNPLPPSLEIRVQRASSVSAVARDLVALRDVQDVVYAGKLADKLAKLSRFAGRFSAILLFVAITASGVVLFNTIRIAVYSKQEEINIMLLVGATPAFVALPFVLQGVLLGGVGALAAAGLVAATYQSALERLRDLLPFLSFLEGGFLTLKLGLILVGAGVTVSLVSSLMAVERFIRRSLRPL
jgi:cell division transport system permease protein